MKSALRLLALGTCLLSITACGSTPSVDPSLQLQRYDDQNYADVLAATVRDGLVDYAAFDEELEQKLNIYLDAIGRFGPRATPEQFPTQEAQLAFYTNAYNAIMLRLWLDNGAKTADADDGVQWLVWFTLPQWSLDGSSMTLDSLEQRIIRPQFDDPRFHAALVCGAISCPPLRDEPYVGERLDEQFADQMRTWLSDPKGDGLVVQDDGTVRMSAIFDWYRGDFKEIGGLEGVIEKYVTDDDPRKARALEAARNDNLKFLDYNWDINLITPQSASR